MYKAKNHYQSTKEARRYDQLRFASMIGRLAHQGEERSLRIALKQFATRPGLVLDLPCGTGRMFDVLSESKLNIVGVDISETMLEQATVRIHSRQSAQPQPSTLRTDAEHLPFSNNAFDYLVSYRFFCHLPREIRLSVLAEMSRVTRHVMIINYHLRSNAPLAFFNRIFRPHSYPRYPALKEEIYSSAKALNLQIASLNTLSWYEQSSCLVILTKEPAS